MPFSWKNQAVVLTGGTGFLGRNMQEALKRFRPDRCEVFAPPHFMYDLTNQKSVQQLYEAYKPTAVVHMAGLVGGIGANLAKPADFFHQNLLMGTLVMQHAYKSGRVVKFVAVGAGCGYPEYAPIPIREDDLWNGYPQAPSAPYSLAKRMLVVQAQAMYTQYGFKSVIGMPGNIFGPFDNFNLADAHVIPALVRKFVEAADSGQPVVEVWGSGRASRDFVYVSDVCDGLIHIAEAFEAPELVNLSTGVETSIAQVVNHLVRLTGFKGAVAWDKTKPDGQLRRHFSTVKAAVSGWRAKVGLEEGLARTVEWYRANQEKARK